MLDYNVQVFQKKKERRLTLDDSKQSLHYVFGNASLFFAKLVTRHLFMKIFCACVVRVIIFIIGVYSWPVLSCQRISILHHSKNIAYVHMLACVLLQIHAWWACIVSWNPCIKYLRLYCNHQTINIIKG